MSRIGKKPVQIPQGITVEVKNDSVLVKGPKGQLEMKAHPLMKIEIKDKEIVVSRTGEERLDKSLHGLTRTLIANMVEGVTKGYEKKLEIQGVGFRAQVQGQKLTLNVGFSHSVEFTAPKGITFSIDQEKKNIIIITGIDKQLVGETAAKIRSIRKPEPYKGKGVRYLGEIIQRKAGKTAAGTTAGGK